MICCEAMCRVVVHVWWLLLHVCGLASATLLLHYDFVSSMIASHERAALCASLRSVLRWHR